MAHPRDLETDALHLADSAEIVLNGIETGVAAPGARVRIGVTVIQRLGLVRILIVVDEGTKTD